MKMKKFIMITAIGCLFSALACHAAETEVMTEVASEPGVASAAVSEFETESYALPEETEIAEVPAQEAVVDEAVKPESEVCGISEPVPESEGMNSDSVPLVDSAPEAEIQDDVMIETETSGEAKTLGAYADSIVDGMTQVTFLLPKIPENCVVEYRIRSNEGEDYDRWTSSGIEQDGYKIVRLLPKRRSYFVYATARFIDAEYGTYFEQVIPRVLFQLDDEPIEVNLYSIEGFEGLDGMGHESDRQGILRIEIPELPINIDKVRYVLCDSLENPLIEWFVAGGSKQGVHDVPFLPYGTYIVTSELIGDNGDISQTGEDSVTIQFDASSEGKVYRVPFSITIPPFPAYDEIETVPATCVEPEYTVYRRNGVETMREESAPAKGHSWGGFEIVEKATVLKTGIGIRRCSVCGAEEREQIHKLRAFAKMSKSSAVLLKNRTLRLKVSYADGDSVLYWSSSDSNTASVSNGLVRAKKAGSATVTVILKSGKKATSRIVVKNPTTTNLKVSAPGLRNGVVSLRVGQKIKLTAVKTPIDSADAVRFSSSSPKIVSSSLTGTIKGLKKGTSRITVKSGKKTVSVTVTVR